MKRKYNDRLYKNFFKNSVFLQGQFWGNFFLIVGYMIKSKNCKCHKRNKTSGVMESVNGGGYYFSYKGHRKPLLGDSI